MATRKNIGVSGTTIERCFPKGNQHIFRNAETKGYALVARCRLNTDDARFAVSGDLSLEPDQAQREFLDALFTRLEQGINAKEQL